MKVDRLPLGGYRPKSDWDLHVYSALRNLLPEVRDDPVKLSAACYAMCWNGMAWQYLASDVYPERGYNDLASWATIQAAFLHRRERDVRHRAEGLLIAAYAWAEAVERDRVHELQVDVGIRTCKVTLRGS